METESVLSVLSLLIWGGLFFLMMRYGCGAHIMGGHGHHGGAARDPVCGMEVDPQRAAGASVHEGKTYYFCSASCRDKFEQAPQKYLSAPAQAGHEHGGGRHG